MKQFVLIFFFVLNTSLLVSNPTRLVINKEKITKLTTEYITVLQKTINNQKDDYISFLDSTFVGPFYSEHIYDLKELAIKEDNVYSYFSFASKSKKIQKIEIDLEAIYIYPCTYSDPKTIKNYSYVKVTKDFYWNETSKKSSLNHILEIDVTDTNYKIVNVYDFNEDTEKKYINKCMKIKSDTKKQMEIAKSIELLYEQVGVLFGKKEYLKALAVIEEILILNSEYEEAIAAKEQIVGVITYDYLEAQMLNELAQENFNKAKNILMISQNNNFENYAQLKLLFEEAKEKQQQDIEFKKAEYFFSLELYQKALPIYVLLEKKGFEKNVLKNRINTCKEADPNLIRKRISTAYNNAVASNKYYKNTFKTYYKYENSGYLNASNYRFMCLMMIGKGNKSLLREMNISKNQSKNMAINYFFKAKQGGKDMRDVEFIVFTKNFLKKLKN